MIQSRCDAEWRMRNRRELNTPIGVDKRRAERALLGLNQEKGLEARVVRISGLFRSRRYAENPLGGGPECQELFRVSFEEFDCVTYVETVLALSCSKTAARFFHELRHLRYKSGKVDWFHRNHFITSWLRRNVARGVVADLTRGRDSVPRTRMLSGVAGLPPEQVTFRLFPKRRYAKVRSMVRTGDFVMFVSTKKHLDVFHMGILIRDGDQILLRHATRSAGKVIEQDLIDFVLSNRMSGFILARPRCRP
jgi:hypothetical protein